MISIEPFGEFLHRRLAETGLSQRAFARATGHNAGFVNQVRHGQRRPPLRRLERWFDALQLNEQERERARLLAQLEHAPEPVRMYIARLEAGNPSIH